MRGWCSGRRSGDCQLSHDVEDRAIDGTDERDDCKHSGIGKGPGGTFGVCCCVMKHVSGGPFAGFRLESRDCTEKKKNVHKHSSLQVVVSSGLTVTTSMMMTILIRDQTRPMPRVSSGLTPATAPSVACPATWERITLLTEAESVTCVSTAPTGCAIGAPKVQTSVTTSTAKRRPSQSAMT
jgi:hypothetical protein